MTRLYVLYIWRNNKAIYNHWIGMDWTTGLLLELKVKH